MDPAARTYFNSGNDKIKNKDFKSAIVYYDSALITSQDHRIYYYKGIALRMLEKNEDAIASFNEAVKVNPTYDQVYNALGSAYFATNNMELAISNFKKFIEFSTDTARISKAKEFIAKSYGKLALDNIAQSKPDSAIALLNEAESYAPLADAKTYFSRSYCMIANELINQNSLDSARLMLTKAIENEETEIADLYFARLSMKSEQWDDVIKYAEKALRLKAAGASAGPHNLYIGMAYRAKNDNIKAKEYLNLALTDEKVKKQAEAELQKIK